MTKITHQVDCLFDILEKGEISQLTLYHLRTVSLFVFNSPSTFGHESSEWLPTSKLIRST
jgi:hypothetical protein